MNSLGQKLNEGEVKVHLSDKRHAHGDLHIGIDLSSKTFPAPKDWYVTRDGPWSDFLKSCEVRTKAVREQFGVSELEILLSRETWTLSVVAFGRGREESALWMPSQPGWLSRPTLERKFVVAVIDNEEQDAAVGLTLFGPFNKDEAEFVRVRELEKRGVTFAGHVFVKEHEEHSWNLDQMGRKP